MELVTFFVVFGIVFVGELGDKTQLIVFNLALEYKKFYKVGIGVTVGFVVLVTLGVFLGVVITRFVPLFIISIASGIVFIIIGILEAVKLKKLYLERKSDHFESVINQNHKESDYEKSLSSKLSKFKKNPYFAGFVYIFIMELGDKTQLLTISLSSRYIAYPLEVWFGAFLALVSVAWIGILLGGIIAQKVPKFYLKIISTSIFIFVGIWILITSF
ncbi:MAG: TMEM165/GDT1 family protein [Promethearchaeota archaeon]|nr:MAG: TMEM165/GDT1 family protein [Candidatus Lokiarchaeota archaeon]